MSCRECEERRAKLRAAILRGKIAEAAGHAVAGAAEMIGLMPVDVEITPAASVDLSGVHSAPVTEPPKPRTRKAK